MAKKPKTTKNAAPDIVTMLKAADGLRKTGRIPEAMRAYQVLLGYVPDLLPALYNLGQIHRHLTQYSDAEYCFRRMLHTAPNDLEAMTALAAVCIEQGGTEEARQLATHAATMSSAPFIQMRCSIIMRRAGDLVAAQTMAERAVAEDPDCIDGYYSLSNLKKFKEGDADFKNLNALAERAGAFPDQQRIKLEFALGNAKLDVGRDAEAFDHYATGNRLQRLVHKHVTVDMLEKYIDSIIALFTPELVQKFAHVGAVDTDRPVFIIGMPRSGSTLTEQILSSHPQMAAMGEVNFLQNSLPAYPNAEVPQLFPPGMPTITKKLVESLSSDVLDDIAKKYLQLTEPFARVGAKLSDKMLFNFLYVGIIRLALPNAKIVHCTRDPMAIGLSIWQKMFHADLFWAYDQREIGRYYRAYTKLMAHWNKLFPGQIFEANYETMVANQERETRRLLEFCGLPWDERCLKFNETDRPVITASASQVRQSIYTGSLERWRKYETYLQPLIQALKDGR
ncbi:MAG: sulfotransferase [bacterium]|nr:sulfotransferase [bacterium]